MDFSSQRQYIQRAEDVHINIATASTDYTVYTSPSGNDFNFSVIISFLVCEHQGQQTQIDVTNTHGGTTYNLFSNKVISANSTSDLLVNPLIIHQGEIIKVQASHAGNLDIHMSVIEYAKGD